jgi:hypothetical protein
MSIRRSCALLVTAFAVMLSLLLPTAATAAPATGRHAVAQSTHSLVVHPNTHHPKKHHKPHKPKPKKVARTTPSSAEVQSAIQGLKKYVHSFFSPSKSQVAELGNDVCTAFDKGQTVKQIEATMLAKVKKLPLTTVLPGAANYVVTTAVKLYCPGYKSKI